MRIIGGRFRGRQLKVPRGLPVRPTTDFAKEALFNILNNRLDYEGLEVLDLFSGTGHISLEFASRGCRQATAVDKHVKCVSFLRQIADELKLPVSTVKEDVFKFLAGTRAKFDLVFADPPYDLPELITIHTLVFANRLLKEGGLLILEHGPATKTQSLPNFWQHRKYGNVNFSFFLMPEQGDK